MSHRPRTLGRSAVVAACLAMLVGPAGAQAASSARNVQFDVPSLKGNVNAGKAMLNDTKKLTAWVRLPAGYDDQPNRKWPVLYLLHGWEDNSYGWLDAKKGSIDTVLPADFDGIVVSPEGGKEWFLNWFNDEGNPGHRWSDYLLEEVVPFMESNLRIAPGRSNHAIGGLSMGGYGAVLATQALPTYFGHALSFSGLLDNQDLSFSSIFNIASIGKPGFPTIFGPQFGSYATSLNPIKNARDFAGSRLTVTYGTPSVLTLFSLDIRARAIATLEIGAQGHARQFVTALKGTGADVITTNRPNGSHDWKWWKQDLADSVKRGLFNPTPITETSQATNWAYDTMATHGNAWGIGYQMQGKVTKKTELLRSGDTLTGKGSGTIRISAGAADADASGNGTRADCTYTLTLPFTQQLPAGC